MEASITILYQPTSSAVKAAGTAASAALGGAIGASVAGAVAGAAGGAAGGSVGGASGSSASGGSANLLGMVGFAQVFTTTSQMSASGLSPEYKDMSNSLGWVMLDVKVPFVKSSSSSQNGTGNWTSSAAGRRRLYERTHAEWGFDGGRHQVFVLGPRGSAAFLSVDRLGIPAEMDPRRRRLQDSSSSTQPGLDQLQGVSFASEVGNQLSFVNGAVVGAANAVPGAAATFAAAQAQATALQQSVASKFNLASDPYVRVQEVVFIVWLAVVAVTLLQILLVFLIKRKGREVPPALLFPKPQLLLGVLLFPPVATAAAGCFKDGSRQAVGVGVLLLLSLPVPLLLYMLYVPIREVLLPHADLRRLFYEASGSPGTISAL